METEKRNIQGYCSSDGRSVGPTLREQNRQYRLEHELPKFVEPDDEIKAHVAKELARIRVNIEKTLAMQRKKK